MANGRAEHAIPPHAMQLGLMLRREGTEGNGKEQSCGWCGGGVQLQAFACTHTYEYRWSG